MSSLLESFRTAYRNLNLLPLQTPEDVEQFGVEYGQESIEQLEQVIEDCPDTNNKVIFAGHRGCGKSTLLGKLVRQFQAGDRFFVVFFSIASTVEMSDVNHVNILFSIALRLMAQAEAEKIPIPEETKRTIATWFATHTRVESEQLNTSISGGFNLWDLITSKLQIDATVREDLKQEFTNKVFDLVGQLDEIAAVIHTYSRQEVLVVIDDLDKLDLPQARSVFYENVNALFEPAFRIVFTIPIAAMRELVLRRTVETKSGNQVKSMRVTKFFAQGENRDPAAEPRQEAVQVFESILYKRLPPELIEPATARQLILKSGGVLRELIRIANECCTQSLIRLRRNKDRQEFAINDEILQQALNELRNDMAAPLRKLDYDILTTVYEQFLPNNESEEAEQRFLNLLHGVYILEYRNADDWYDVHPIIIDLLERRGRIGDGSNARNG